MELHGERWPRMPLLEDEAPPRVFIVSMERFILCDADGGRGFCGLAGQVPSSAGGRMHR